MKATYRTSGSTGMRRLSPLVTFSTWENGYGLARWPIWLMWHQGVAVGSSRYEGSCAAGSKRSLYRCMYLIETSSANGTTKYCVAADIVPSMAPYQLSSYHLSLTWSYTALFTDGTVCELVADTSRMAGFTEPIPSTPMKQSPWQSRLPLDGPAPPGWRPSPWPARAASCVYPMSYSSFES